MAAQQPICCRAQAFELLAEQLPQIETTAGLVRGAVAISMHELPSADPIAVEAGLAGLIHQIRDRVHTDSPQAILAHAHEVLFEEQGFMGDTHDYENARNSYLPSVLETHKGLPITLVLLYKAVLEGVGLRVYGINSPGHFLAAVATGGRTPSGDPDLMLVDVFNQGTVLHRDEARQRIAEMTGLTGASMSGDLGVATHRQWLGRMLNNLQGVFANTRRKEDLMAMLELRSLLERK